MKISTCGSCTCGCISCCSDCHNSSDCLDVRPACMMGCDTDMSRATNLFTCDMTSASKLAISSSYKPPPPPPYKPGLAASDVPAPATPEEPAPAASEESVPLEVVLTTSCVCPLTGLTCCRRHPRADETTKCTLSPLVEVPLTLANGIWS